MDAPSGSPAAPRPISGLWFAAALLATLVVYACFGERSEVRLAIPILLATGIGLALLGRIPAPIISLLPLALLTPSPGGWQLFDLIALVLAGLALWKTSQRNRHSDWDLHAPGWLCLMLLAAPLGAVLEVQSWNSFLGGYKSLLCFSVVFLALRRLIARSDSDQLPLAFPILGIAIVGQLFAKTAGVGALLGRLNLRNFYTDLGWGRSNAIAAALLICLCGSTLAILVRPKPWIRLAIGLAMLLMLQGFVILYSRSATVCLSLFLVVLVVGLGGWLRIAATAAGSLAAVFLFTSAPGKILLGRFTDAREYLSWGERVRLWDVAWTRFLSSPWVGLGLNQGRYVRDPLDVQRPHNWLLEVLMEQGILGGVATVVVLCAILRVCWRFRPTEHEGRNRSLRTCALGMILAVVTQSMVEPTIPAYVMTIPMIYLLVWMTLHDDGPTPSTRISSPKTGTGA